MKGAVLFVAAVLYYGCDAGGNGKTGTLGERDGEGSEPQLAASEPQPGAASQPLSELPVVGLPGTDEPSGGAGGANVVPGVSGAGGDRPEGGAGGQSAPCPEEVCDEGYNCDPDPDCWLDLEVQEGCRNSCGCCQIGHFAQACREGGECWNSLVCIDGTCWDDCPGDCPAGQESTRDGCVAVPPADPDCDASQACWQNCEAITACGVSETSAERLSVCGCCSEGWREQPCLADGTCHEGLACADGVCRECPSCPAGQVSVGDMSCIEPELSASCDPSPECEQSCAALFGGCSAMAYPFENEDIVEFAQLLHCGCCVQGQQGASCYLGTCFDGLLCSDGSCGGAPGVCENDGGCPINNFCSEGQCRPIPCAADSDCVEEKTVCHDGECLRIACALNFPCPEGYSCETEEGAHYGNCQRLLE